MQTLEEGYVVYLQVQTFSPTSGWIFDIDPVPMALFPYLGGTGDSHENHHQSL